MNAIVAHQHYAPAVPLSDLERMARAFAASRLFGVQNEEQALALCLVAQAEGRHPASAAQDYHIIQGRPAKKADAMLRDFITSGGKVEWHALDDEVADATFSHPSGGTVRISWDHERAKAAQIKNPMWSKFPRQMLRSRVVSEGVRTVCPGATSGMYEPGEVAEFEPVRETLTPVDDFDPTPQPRISAKKAREEGVFEKLQASLRDCQTEAELTAWAKEHDDDLGRIPHGWTAEIRKEWVELRDSIRAKAADPNGLFVIPPDDDDDLADYVAAVCDLISGSPDAAQVTEAQTINAEGLSRAMARIEGVAETLACAAEARLAMLASRETEAA